MSLLKPREKDKKQDRSHLLPLLLLSRFSCCCYYCFYCCCWKSVAGAGSRKSAALRWKHAGKQPPAARENSIGGCTWFVLAVVFVVVVVAAVVHKFSSLTRSPLLSAGVGRLLYYWYTDTYGIWFFYSRRFATATARTASLGSHSRDISIYIKIIYVHIEWTVHTVNDVSHCSLLLPLFSSIAVAPRQEPLCGRHGLNDVVLTPSRPLVTANDVGHWDQKHPKVLIVGKKTRRIW